MKTSKQAVNLGRQIRIPAAPLAAILGLVLTATGFAQKTISKEEYEKRQAGLMQPIIRKMFRRIPAWKRKSDGGQWHFS